MPKETFRQYVFETWATNVLFLAIIRLGFFSWVQWQKNLPLPLAFWFSWSRRIGWELPRWRALSRTECLCFPETKQEPQWPVFRVWIPPLTRLQNNVTFQKLTVWYTKPQDLRLPLRFPNLTWIICSQGLFWCLFIQRWSLTPSASSWAYLLSTDQRDHRHLGPVLVMLLPTQPS